VTACCVWDLSLAHAERTAQKQRGDWPAAKAQPLRIRWGKDDQIGTLNHVKPEDVVKAAFRAATWDKNKR
jgi:hypothetical protein